MSNPPQLSLVSDGAASGGREPIEREHRYSVFLSGSIRRLHSPNGMPIKIRNISSTGLMAVCAYPARIDDPVEIELPRIGPVTGRVRWGGGGRIGIEFENPIDPAETWTRQDKSEVLFELPRMDTRRPGVLSAH